MTTASTSDRQVTAMTSLLATTSSAKADRVVALRHVLTGETWTIDGGDEVVLGAGPGSDVRIVGVGVSACHARLRRESRGWTVYDQSRNGTFLGGQRAAVFVLAAGTRFDVAHVPLLAMTPAMLLCADALPLYLGLDQPAAVSLALIAPYRPDPVALLGPRGHGQPDVARLLHLLSPTRTSPLVELTAATAARTWSTQARWPRATGVLDVRETRLAEPMARARRALLGDDRWRWVLAASSEGELARALDVPHVRGAHVMFLPRLDERTDDRRALVERLLQMVAPVGFDTLPERARRHLTAHHATLDDLREVIRRIGTIAIIGVTDNAAQALGLHREHLALLAEKFGFSR